MHAPKEGWPTPSLTACWEVKGSWAPWAGGESSSELEGREDNVGTGEPGWEQAPQLYPAGTGSPRGKAKGCCSCWAKGQGNGTETGGSGLVKGHPSRTW